MASGIGLRRASFTETQTKGEEDGLLGSPPDKQGQSHGGSYVGTTNGRKQPHGSRSRPGFNSHQCALTVLTAIAVSLLVICFRFPLGILDPVVSEAYELIATGAALSTLHSGSSSAHPQLRKEQHQYASYDGNLVRPLSTRILPRKPKKNLIPSRTCPAAKNVQFPLGVGAASQAYHSSSTFYEDFMDMVCHFKIYIYPHNAKDPFANIYRPYKVPPTGNYASEHFFKMALLNSDLLTDDPTKADLFYMPFSIANMRNDARIGVSGIKHFVKDYVGNISLNYPYWERSGGADHFYVNCHSIGKTATDEALHVRLNAIQVVCSSSYHIPVFYPHKDATIPQVWPRTGFPKQAPLIKQRTTLAFFAGAGNSPIRALVAKHWSNDSEIKVYTQRIKTPYDVALLTSKYCLHVKGFEVNTARLADAMHYGCVPIIIANYHDLPFNDLLDWRRFSLVVTHEDIPKLKDIIHAVSDEEYVQMQKNVMQVRQHFQWHQKPEHFDAFYTVMYELWLRRHVTRFQFREDDYD